MTHTARRPSGEPAGGQFAPAPVAEPQVRLDATSHLHAEAAQAVIDKLIPVVEEILRRDEDGTEVPLSGWDGALAGATNAILGVASRGHDLPGLRGPDGLVTIIAANPNGPGHGDLVFRGADLRDTAFGVISHFVEPAVGMARFDARDGRDVNWEDLRARCRRASDAIVNALNGRAQATDADVDAPTPHITHV